VTGRVFAELNDGRFQFGTTSTWMGLTDAADPARLFEDNLGLN